MIRPLAIAAACLALTACATATFNSQSPTFTEQKLTSDAGARAVAQDNMVCRSGATERCITRGTKTFIRVLAGADKPAGQMVAAEFRQELAPQLAVVDDIKDADVVIDLVVKAAGIDDSDYIVGVASMTIPPIPGKTSASSITPEISLYSRHDRQGGVELAATATNAHTHVFITAVNLWGATNLRRGSLMTGLTWGRVTDPPGIQATAGR